MCQLCCGHAVDGRVAAVRRSSRVSDCHSVDKWLLPETAISLLRPAPLIVLVQYETHAKLERLMWA